MYLFSFIFPSIFVIYFTYLKESSFVKKRVLSEFFKGVSSFIPVLLFFLASGVKGINSYGLSDLYIIDYLFLEILPIVIFSIWYILIHGQSTQVHYRRFSDYLVHSLGFIMAFSFFDIYLYRAHASFFVLFLLPLIRLITIYIWSYFISMMYEQKGAKRLVPITLFLVYLSAVGNISVLYYFGFELIAFIITMVLFAIFFIIGFVDKFKIAKYKINNFLK